LLKAVENEKAYNIEYTVKRSEEDQRHLLSTVAIGFNGRLVICTCHLHVCMMRKAPAGEE
jgi:hypothetical protein